MAPTLLHEMAQQECLGIAQPGDLTHGIIQIEQLFAIGVLRQLGGHFRGEVFRFGKRPQRLRVVASEIEVAQQLADQVLSLAQSVPGRAAIACRNLIFSIQTSSPKSSDASAASLPRVAVVRRLWRAGHAPCSGR